MMLSQLDAQWFALQYNIKGSVAFNLNVIEVLVEIVFPHPVIAMTTI